MSFKGAIEAECPNGCESFEAEIWSFIRGEKDAPLRNAILARECNLLLCPGCEAPFFPAEPYIYYEPQAELLAFVFPESFRDREEHWRSKMRDDFLLMKKSMGDQLPIDVEPIIFFGQDGLAELLEAEDFRGDECDVMACYAKELGLGLFHVSAAHARAQGIPALLPYDAQGSFDRPSLIAGLEKVVAANDRLTAYATYLEALRAAPRAPLPPAAPGVAR